MVLKTSFQHPNQLDSFSSSNCISIRAHKKPAQSLKKNDMKFTLIFGTEHSSISPSATHWKVGKSKTDKLQYKMWDEAEKQVRRRKKINTIKNDLFFYQIAQIKYSIGFHLLREWASKFGFLTKRLMSNT